MIVAAVLLYADMNEGMAIEKRGRPFLIAAWMTIPAIVLVRLVLGSGGLFNEANAMYFGLSLILVAAR